MGLSANKGWQEGVMDIDDPVRKGCNKLLAQHLHMARQHHQLDTCGFDRLYLVNLLLKLVFSRDGKVFERDAIAVAIVAASGWLLMTSAISALNSPA